MMSKFSSAAIEHIGPRPVPGHHPPVTLADVDIPAGRRRTDHLAFGHGIHHCLGASLARLEARIVSETILRHLVPDDGAQRIDSLIPRDSPATP